MKTRQETRDAALADVDAAAPAAVDSEKRADARHVSGGAFNARSNSRHRLGGGSFAEFAPLGGGLALPPEVTRVVEPFVFTSKPTPAFACLVAMR
jgi:hypothetical protein